MNDDPLQIGANALANSSRTPIERSQVVDILRTGDGLGHLVRALFEDCSRESLERMAMHIGVTSAQLHLAYQQARRNYAAMNVEMEDDESQVGR
jgi:hypothetical protein